MRASPRGWMSWMGKDNRYTPYILNANVEMHGVSNMLSPTQQYSAPLYY